MTPTAILLLALAGVDDIGWQANDSELFDDTTVERSLTENQHTNRGKKLRRSRSQWGEAEVSNANLIPTQRDENVRRLDSVARSFDDLRPQPASSFDLSTDLADDFEQADFDQFDLAQRDANLRSFDQVDNSVSIWDESQLFDSFDIPERGSVRDWVFSETNELDETQEEPRLLRGFKERLRRYVSDPRSPWVKPLPTAAPREMIEDVQPERESIPRRSFDRRQYLTSRSRSRERESQIDDDLELRTVATRQDRIDLANRISDIDRRPPSSSAREINRSPDKSELHALPSDLDRRTAEKTIEEPDSAALSENSLPTKTTEKDSTSSKPLASGNWWPFLLAFAGLLLSVGMNFYFGWIAWDMHLKYQDAVAELSDVETRGTDLLARDTLRSEEVRPRSLVRRRSVAV